MKKARYRFSIKDHSLNTFAKLSKQLIFLTPDTQVCVSRDEKCYFSGNFANLLNKWFLVVVTPYLLLNKFIVEKQLQENLAPRTTCVKSVQIQCFFSSVFCCIRTKYGDLRSPNKGKYGPEKTLYLDTFHAVIHIQKYQDF